jgi:prepilin-type N-terminal cleavage/methylation domain-containing protein
MARLAVKARMRIFQTDRQKRKENSRGFTLFELLIVLLLIVIFITFVSVRWRPEKSGVDRFVDQFNNAVKLLKEESITNYENRFMEFDVTEKTIHSGYFDGVNGYIGRSAVEMPEDYRIKDVVINGQVFSLGKHYMLFSPSGTMDRVVLHLENEDNFYSLLVNPLTAKVTGENGYAEETVIPKGNNPS